MLLQKHLIFAKIMFLKSSLFSGFYKKVTTLKILFSKVVVFSVHAFIVGLKVVDFFGNDVQSPRFILEMDEFLMILQNN